jgi:hypothetical protein
VRRNSQNLVDLRDSHEVGAITLTGA